MKPLLSKTLLTRGIIVLLLITSGVSIFVYNRERNSRKVWKKYSEALLKTQQDLEKILADQAAKAAEEMRQAALKVAVAEKSESAQKPAATANAPAAPADAAAPTQVVAAATPAPIETYDQYMSLVREQTRFVLDTPPDRWSPGSVEYAPFELPQLPASVTPKPNETPRDEVVKQHPLLRPMPYPFHRALSVPSDCCGSAWQDYFYTHTLLARKLGLDLPSSFFPTVLNAAGHDFGIPGVFSDESYSPRTSPVHVEHGSVDAWPYFLMNYYRGWIDHTHSWTDDSSAGITLVEPAVITLGNDGERLVDLSVRKNVLYPFVGLVLDLVKSDGIDAWEIELSDPQNLKHVICAGIPLGDRQGWDVTDRSPEDLTHLILPLEAETNRSDLHALGRRNDKFTPIAGATLRVKGKAGGTFELRRVRDYHLTREQIRAQMATFKKFNVLPSVTSYHGGSSGWGVPVERGLIRLATTEVDGRTSDAVLAKTGEGGDPRSPSYHTDLLQEFGIVFYELPPTVDADRLSLEIAQAYDGSKFWTSRKGWVAPKPSVIPFRSSQWNHGEGLGSLVGAFLQESPTFGAAESLYTHYNLYNACVLKDQTASAQMHRLKKLFPDVEAGLKLLSNAHYNWTGDLEAYQRVWAVPTGARMRFLRTLRQIEPHVTLTGNDVRIKSWRDQLTDQPLPDPLFPTLDLHGQTFYVPDADLARVFIDDRELTWLKRNPPDHTGRASVTVIDTTTPTRIFDELDLYDHNGRLIAEKASYFYRSRDAHHGKHALEIRADAEGASSVRWDPVRLDCHETQYLRFAYRKANAESRFELSWKLLDGTETVVTDGELNGRQGWQIKPVHDTKYHAVVLDFADMQSGKAGKKLPRGAIESLTFGLQQAKLGDSIWFDQIEFLAARGVRSHLGQGCVVGGQVNPPVNGEKVELRIGNEVRETFTTRGGWYIFEGVPVDAVAEIVYRKQQQPHYPLQGRLIDVARNSLEYHIYTHDSRNPAVPRPNGYAGQVVTDTMNQRFGPGDRPMQDCAAIYVPHADIFYAGLPGNKSSYLIEDRTNNYGWIDKDRDEPNLDHAIRICMQGECWTEGRQSYTAQQMNVLLESMLRQRLGVPVEVIKDGTSSSSPASYADRFDRYAMRFKPDLVVMFVNPFNMAHMEPTLFNRLFGWSKEHSPYRMYDFDATGKLVEYPADPGYGAFQGSPANYPLFGSVPMYQAYAIPALQHELCERTFDLLRAVLRAPYKQKLAEHGGKVALIHGYCQGLPLDHVMWSTIPVVNERWRQRVNDFCRDNDVISLDLTNHLQNEAARAVVTYEHDAHPTPMGHYLIASALTTELLKLPELQKLADKHRREHPESANEPPLPVQADRKPGTPLR